MRHKTIRRGAGVAMAMLLMASCAEPPPPKYEAAPKRAKTLRDYSAVEISAAYGAPNFVRKENGSEIWRYDIGACRIFFFFAPGDGGLRLRHLQSVPAGNPIDANCRAAFELRRKKNG